MSLGSKIYELRTAANLSQTELSDILDVSRQSVSKWETDSAVPDLDKLMKLCDVFGVTLDELTERVVSGEIERRSPNDRPLPSPTQRVLGYILFGLSLALGLVLLFFGVNEGDFLILMPIALALFACSMLCLFLKRHAFYWCVWTALAPFSLLTPHVVGFGVLHAFSVIQTLVFVIMGFAAFATFSDVKVSVNRKKGIMLAAAWVLTVALYVLNFSITSSYWLLSFIFNFLLFAMVAVLETYTACFIRSRGK